MKSLPIRKHRGVRAENVSDKLRDKIAAATKAVTPKARMQALGRLKTGEMNKTERAYAALLEGRRIAGEVAWYKFEAMKFRLADNTFYEPDFAVMLSDGQLQMHEVKGVWTDDARVKIKVAAEIHPVQFIAIRLVGKGNAQRWEYENF